MTYAMWYWLVLVLSFFLNGFVVYRADPAHRIWGVNALPFWILFIIIGLKHFGPIVGK